MGLKHAGTGQTKCLVESHERDKQGCYFSPHAPKMSSYLCEPPAGRCNTKEAKFADIFWVAQILIREEKMADAFIKGTRGHENGVNHMLQL